MIKNQTEIRATRDNFKAHALFADLKCLISYCAFNGFPKNSPANQRFRPALRHTTAHAPHSTKSSDLLTSPGVLLYSIAALNFFFFFNAFVHDKNETTTPCDRFSCQKQSRSDNLLVALWSCKFFQLSYVLNQIRLREIRQ